MRVVSQSKNYSVDFDRTAFWMQDDIIYAKIDSENKVFGKYDTSKRASEVFMDMHNAYAPVYSISDGLTEEQIGAMLFSSKNVRARNITNAGPDMCLTTFDSYVYYMPEH